MDENNLRRNSSYNLKCYFWEELNRASTFYLFYTIILRPRGVRCPDKVHTATYEYSMENNLDASVLHPSI